MNKGKKFSILGGAILSLVLAAPAVAETIRVKWYGPGYHGNLTANGEIFNQWAHTAAHPSWPFGTTVRVTNSKNGKSVVVRINDRSRRVLDVSRKAARDLGIIKQGVADLDYQIIKWGN